MHNKRKLPCWVNWKMWFLFWFPYSIQQWVYIRTPVNKAWLWNWRKMGGLKQTKEKWEWVGMMGSYSPIRGTFWFKAVNQSPPPKKRHTHTHRGTHCCYSLPTSRCTWRNPSNPKKHMIPNLGEEGKERTQMFPCPCLNLSPTAWWGVWEPWTCALCCD